jgi:rare lipoprotein A (peptidoglycan hydrolase)
MTPPKAARQVTLTLRIAALGAVALLAPAVLPVHPPGGATAEAAPSLASLRAKRQVLVREIAAATDRLARAEADAAAAEVELTARAGQLEEARLAVAHHAVAAFVAAADQDEMAALRGRTWSEALADADRGELDRLRGEARALRSAQELARQTAAQVEAERDGMEALRAELERTIASRERADAAAARARRAATAASGALPIRRAVPATRDQATLMTRFPFGPVGGLPSGLATTGEVVEGPASWYGPGFDGRTTASGAVFDQEGWTVASRTLPLGTMLLITRGERHVLALVNDRGPYVGGRVLDLSKGVAAALDTIGAGVAPVRAEVVVPAG